jgi:hypothetical protein
MSVCIDIDIELLAQQTKCSRRSLSHVSCSFLFPGSPSADLITGGTKVSTSGAAPGVSGRGRWPPVASHGEAKILFISYRGGSAAQMVVATRRNTETWQVPRWAIARPGAVHMQFTSTCKDGK